MFSDSLNLARPEDRKPTLNQRRSDITQRLRENRKRGVVAVFVSFLWFLVALAISIQSAFGHIGENQQAHDLALGFLLGWLPILVLASIVDRNPIASGSIRSELNHLLSDVRKALLDDELRGRYMEDEGRSPSQFAWTTNLIHRETGANPWDEFFTEFAGQGRERWHYGVAHPMLAAIEKDFLAGKGRNWLEDPNFARTRIILDSKSAAGLRAFDPRMTWQILGAICLVCGNVGGAFILSCKIRVHRLKSDLLLIYFTQRLHPNRWPRLSEWWIHDLYDNCFLHLHGGIIDMGAHIGPRQITH